MRRSVTATARKEENGDWFLLTNPKDHLCSPSSTAHQKAEFSRKLYKAIATNPRASLPTLYDELKMEMVVDMDDDTRKSYFGRISTFRNLQKGLYAFRSLFIPKTPVSFKDFNAAHEWLNLSKKGEKESLIKGDIPVTGGRVLVMSTLKSLKRFSRAYAICVDGTFKLCPSLWTQLLIVHAQVGEGTWVPVAFGYLPNKKLETYEAFFKGLTDCMKKHKISKDGSIAATYGMADWEINLRKALMKEFEKVAFKGCHFHYVCILHIFSRILIL